jgi:predicted nucleic acid-binding protein
MPTPSGAQVTAFIDHLAEGIKPIDALHLASAVAAKADYFCTCDDRFLKRAKPVDTGQTKVVSPLELIAEVTQ